MSTGNRAGNLPEWNNERKRTVKDAMRTICLIFALTGALAIGSSAQTDQQTEAASSDTLNARDMFWSSADLVGVRKSGTPAAKAPSAGSSAGGHTTEVKGQLGLRYAVLKVLPGGGQVEVRPDTAFLAGDAIRLGIESNKPSFLYIIQQTSRGTWTSLYPERGEQHEIQPGMVYVIPGGGGRFEFDEHAGQERLFVLLSRTPLRDLESLISEPDSSEKERRAPSPEIDHMISQVKMASRDLIFTMPGRDSLATDIKGGDAAIYVVNKTTNGSHVIVDLLLKHE